MYTLATALDTSLLRETNKTYLEGLGSGFEERVCEERRIWLGCERHSFGIHLTNIGGCFPCELFDCGMISIEAGSEKGKYSGRKHRR